MSAIKWGVKSEVIVRISKAIISKSSLMQDDKQKTIFNSFKIFALSINLKITLVQAWV